MLYNIIMLIEKIVYMKKYAEITADGDVYDRISLSALAEYRLKEGDDVPESVFVSFIKDNEMKLAKEYACSMLARGAKTEKEVKNKLYEKGFLKESVDAALSTVKNYGYVNDEAYSQSYIERNASGKGAYRIKFELKEKGVDDKTIEEAVKNAELDETESARAVAAKFMKGKTNDEKAKERLFRLLASRGFSYDTIKTVLREKGADLDE